VRVAVVVGTFPVLSETFILEQITGLIDRGHCVDVVAFTRGNAADAHEDVHRYGLLGKAIYPRTLPSSWLGRAVVGSALAASHLPRDPAAVVRALNPLRYGRHAASLSLFQTAAPLFGRGPYDVVHCHFGSIGRHVVTLREIGLLRGRFATTFHGHDASLDVRRYGRGIYERLFAEGDLIMAVSHDIKGKLARLGCDPAKIVVHRVGVDCERFRFRERGLSGGPLRIASVARLVEKKGIEFGIRAVGRLAGDGLAVEYRIAGDGELRERLARLVSDLGLKERVTFLGPLTHGRVAELLDGTHVFLAPSTVSADGDEEGVPTGIMEAMAMGIPVVSSVHSGIPELVDDGISGLLARERDVGGITERLEFLAAHPEAWGPMGRAGRARVERDFNSHRLNDDLVGHYERLLAAPGGRRTGADESRAAGRAS
jgi:colanic acid/amylovoran biosynthesis glycosyltransferase